MTELRFLDPDEVDTRYASEVRGGETLAATVERPQRLHHYEGEQDIVVLAAALLRAVNDRHALLDGNKRASIRLTDEFLGINGHRLEGPVELLCDIGWTAGRHGYANDAELAGILRPLVVPGYPWHRLTRGTPKSSLTLLAEVGGFGSGAWLTGRDFDPTGQPKITFRLAESKTATAESHSSPVCSNASSRRSRNSRAFAETHERDRWTRRTTRLVHTSRSG